MRLCTTFWLMLKETFLLGSRERDAFRIRFVMWEEQFALNSETFHND